jgi:hypothetical protein
MPDEITLELAVWRNLSEITYAEYNWLALLEMQHANVTYNQGTASFFLLANYALYNDAIAKLIKVLDTDNRSLTLWYIHKEFREEIDLILKQHAFSIDNLRRFYTEKLKNIRNKTLFHLDLQGVENSSQIWARADIKGDEVRKIIQAIRDSLLHVHNKHFDSNLRHIPYDGTDVLPALQAAATAGLFSLKQN